MGFSSLGRKSAGPSFGSKIGSKLVKGLKVAGLGLVAGAGLYAAYHSRDKLHQDNDALTEKESKELQDELQEKAEVLLKHCSSVFTLEPMARILFGTHRVA